MRFTCKSCFVILVFNVIVFSRQPEQDSVVVFKNVNLITMTSESVISNQTVIIKNKRIFQIGSSVDVEIPDKALIVDGSGLFLMPGVADMHCHPEEFKQPVSPLYIYLANGVTTIRTMSGENDKWLLRAHEDIEIGKRIGPQIFCAGPTFRKELDADTYDYLLKEQKNIGFDFVKIYNGHGRDDYFNLMACAKKNNMYTIGHIPFSVGLDGVISSGMNEIAHIEEIIFNETFPLARERNANDYFEYYFDWAKEILNRYNISGRYDLKKLLSDTDETLNKIAEKIKSANIPVHTTLSIDEDIVMKLFHPEDYQKRIDWDYFPEDYKEAFLQGKDKHQTQFRGIEHLIHPKIALDSALCYKLHKAGIPLVFGTDVYPGFSAQHEFDFLIRCGLTPYQALVTSTVNAAKVVKAMKGKDDFGTIEVGKRADLILLNKNPLENIGNMREIKGVMANGLWLPVERLNELIKIEEKNIPKSGRNALAEIFQEKGFDAVLDQYLEIKNSMANENRINLDAANMNSFGYDLLAYGKIKEAIEVFKLNVDEYPLNANCYDSLGEAYLASGNKEMAKMYYEKALKISPTLESSKKALEQLK